MKKKNVCVETVYGLEEDTRNNRSKQHEIVRSTENSRFVWYG